MGAPSLDIEFMEYWSKLSSGEKESLLTVAKNYVELKHEEEDAEIARKKRIMQDREDYLNGIGKTYSWEEAKEMIVNKEKRNALYH